MEPAGGVQNHEVVAVIPSVAQALPGDGHRIPLALLKHRHPGLLAHHLQLLNSRGTVDVASHQQGPVALAEEILRQLGGVSGLASALKAAEHQNAGGLGGRVQPLVLRAHQGAELVVDDLDYLLGRGQAFQHLRPYGALAHRPDEIPNHLVAYVRLQERHFDLAHSLLDVSLVQPALGAQPLEGLGQLIGKRFKRQKAPSFQGGPAGYS